jgi:hypothetical protein
MNGIEPVPAGSSTSPIRSSLPRIKPPQSRPALAVAALPSRFHPCFRETNPRMPGIAANPQARTGQQGIASKSSLTARPGGQRPKEGHA